MRLRDLSVPLALLTVLSVTTGALAKKNKEKEVEEEPAPEGETELDPNAPNSGVVLEEEPAAEGGDDEFGFDEGGDSEASSSGSVVLSPLDLMLGAGAINRNLHYTDKASDLAINAPLGIADNNVTAAYAALRGHWYPFKNVGIGASYERSLGRKTDYEFPAGTFTYAQTYQAFSGGVRGRLPVSILMFGLEANYGRQALWVRAKDGADPQVFPDTNTSYIEGRLDTTVTVNQLSFTGYFSYRFVMGVGEIGDDDWFPSAKAKSLTYGLEFGYRLSPAWQIVAGIDAESYGYNFNRVDPDTALRIAGGATDRYLSFFGGLRWTLPGSDSNGSVSGDPGSSGGSPESESEAGGFDSFD